MRKQILLHEPFSIFLESNKENNVLELGTKGYYVFDNFLNIDEVKSLKHYFLMLKEKSFLRSVAIGKDAGGKIEKEVRGDLINWADLSALGPVNDLFLRQFILLIEILNRFAFLGIRDFESHFTVYLRNLYYKKHIDRFNNNYNRLISFFCYLNENWMWDVVGKFRIYKIGKKIDITPDLRKIVFFLSEEIEHKVLITQKRKNEYYGLDVKARI